MLRLFRSKILLAITLMVAVLLFGVIGYWLIADYSWVEAFYMTIITVTTVGFGEIRPLGTEGKIFTVFLIILSVFIFAFALSVITEYILSRNSLEILKKKRVRNQIEKLKDHVIVCGFGRNGMQAAERLEAISGPMWLLRKIGKSSKNTKKIYCSLKVMPMKMRCWSKQV